MSTLTTDFFENNDHALRMPKIVLRDSLGQLAVQVLAARKDIGKMSSGELLHDLYEIIVDLHNTYDAERTRIPDI